MDFDRWFSGGFSKIFDDDLLYPNVWGLRLMIPKLGWRLEITNDFSSMECYFMIFHDV